MFRKVSRDDLAYYPPLTKADWEASLIRQEDFETIIITPGWVAVIHEPDGDISVVDILEVPSGRVRQVTFNDWEAS